MYLLRIGRYKVEGFTITATNGGEDPPFFSLKQKQLNASYRMILVISCQITYLVMRLMPWYIG